MLLTILLISPFLVSANAAPKVQIGKTAVVGTEFSPSQVEFFGGIPYAKPPLGRLSLQLPVLATTLDVENFDAKQFGAACLQPGLSIDLISEDCLTINVFRPAGLLPGADLPVMVWIYGGGFFAGSSSLPAYNGTEIVSYSVSRGTPIIFVSFNYRLGPLGFPQGIEAGQRNILNLGLHDQLTALAWLQKNIGQFAGNKSKVTVFGQSAGGTSINIHLLQKKIRQFSRSVILESPVTGAFYGPERNEAAWQQFVASIPTCASVVNTTDTFDCIRRTNSSLLLEALGSVGQSFQPVIDGAKGLIPDRPSKLVPQARLPCIIGTNLDEFNVFTPQDTDSEEEILQALITNFSPSIVSQREQVTVFERILQLYPDVPSLGSPFGTGNNTFGLSSQYKRRAAIFGDVLIQAPRRSFTQKMTEDGVKVFAYYFTDPNAVPIAGLAPLNVAPGSLGVTHSSEIFYVLNELANKTLTAILLRNIMMDYWISFVATLDPNDEHGHKRPKWSPYSAERQTLMELNGHDTREILDNYRSTQITFLQENSNVFHR